jgi:putative ubiquitin-RnfH superfamily antitoxin RatB of RatAB toxin-antitoxin module
MEKLRVEVVFALPEAQHVRSVSLAPGATVADALEASGFRARYPEIDFAHQAIGIFGRRVRLNQKLCQDDRVEIYRMLVADPKSSRRRRAVERRR